MPEKASRATTLDELLLVLRERGQEALDSFNASVAAGHGGIFVIRAPFGTRILPEAGFRTEEWPA